MSTTTASNEFRKPMINVVKLRERIMQSSKLDQQDAEAIAMAIDDSLQQQDTTGFATKGDIRELTIKLNYITYILLFASSVTIGTLAFIANALYKYLPAVAEILKIGG